MNNIILCGFMGCGKSTIGRSAARKSGRRFVDMDTYIEQKASMTVSEIFASQGESAFRELEHQACVELSEMHNLIIASGGGALISERNVNAFKGRDVIVLLDVPLGEIRFRLRNDTKRPLLQRPDKDEVMKELYEKRLPLYRAAADYVVKGNDTPMSTTSRLLELIKAIQGRRA